MKDNMSDYLFRINVARKDNRNLVHEIVDVSKADLKDPAKYRALFEQVLDETVQKFLVNEQELARIDRECGQPKNADRG